MSLREDIIKLANENPSLRADLLPILRKNATNFNTEEALDRYMSEHPGADRSQHHVKAPVKQREYESDSKDWTEEDKDIYDEAMKARRRDQEKPTSYGGPHYDVKTAGEDWQDGPDDAYFLKKIHRAAIATEDVMLEMQGSLQGTDRPPSQRRKWKDAWNALLDANAKIEEAEKIMKSGKTAGVKDED